MAAALRLPKLATRLLRGRVAGWTVPVQALRLVGHARTFSDGEAPAWRARLAVRGARAERAAHPVPQALWRTRSWTLKR